MNLPKAQELPHRAARGLVLFTPLIVYLLLCLHTFRAILGGTGKHFVFALDDPYIHMALAEQIAKGSYGINVGEPASPSSSVIWPFLLAPLVHLHSMPLLVLGLNMLFGAAVCVSIGVFTSRWLSKIEHFWSSHLQAIAIGVALVIVGNLVALTFIGMEHTLQLLMTTVCALGVTTALGGGKLPSWALVAAMLAPIVRYECLALTLAVAIVLVVTGEVRRAIVCITVPLLLLVSFSVFLHHIGLPILPTSVLLKGGVAGGSAAAKGLARTAWHDLHLWRSAVVLWIFDGEYLRLLLLVLALLGCAMHQRTKANRVILLACAGAVALHLIIGRVGWFFRYEVYIVFFAVLILLSIVRPLASEMPLGWLMLGLLGCAFPYLKATEVVAQSAIDVYDQQYQMQRFARDYMHTNVAVNDLGLASYDRAKGEYVQDLFGLGSLAAFRQAAKSTSWMDAITREHNIGLVMIYPQWFSAVPSSWEKLGQLCLDRAPEALGLSCVTYYATPLTSGDEARTAFASFVATLPKGVILVPKDAPMLGVRAIQD